MTDQLIYATSISEKDGYQARLHLVDPQNGDVLAQSQPLGSLRHGLPMFQAQDKIYLALEGGAISFSPHDIELEQLRHGGAETPVTIEVGTNFVQVGGVRLKARG